jgi:hypothetical protein
MKKIYKITLNYRSFVKIIMLAILGCIPTSVIANENISTNIVLNRISKVSDLISTEYKWKNLDSSGKLEIRNLLKGGESEVLSFSLRRIGQKTLLTGEKPNQYRVYLACMATFEKETLDYYKNRIDFRKTLSLRERKVLVSWGYWISNPESFCFVIDRFLEDREFIPYKRVSSEGMLGKSLRYCDRALALAQRRIEGTRDWSVHGEVISLEKIRNRDADLVLFKKWWAENKANLKWSEEKKKFYVDPTQEKGTGILNVKRHRNREQPEIKKQSK